MSAAAGAGAVAGVAALARCGGGHGRTSRAAGDVARLKIELHLEPRALEDDVLVRAPRLLGDMARERIPLVVQRGDDLAQLAVVGPRQQRARAACAAGPAIGAVGHVAEAQPAALGPAPGDADALTALPRLRARQRRQLAQRQRQQRPARAPPSPARRRLLDNGAIDGSLLRSSPRAVAGLGAAAALGATPCALSVCALGGAAAAHGHLGDAAGRRAGAAHLACVDSSKAPILARG